MAPNSKRGEPVSAAAEINRGARQSRFARQPRDLYRTTDPRAVAALLPHLPPRSRFVEPCAGAGDLVRQLEAAGHKCLDAFDIEPLVPEVRQLDALQWEVRPFVYDRVITNPPYRWDLLSAMIPHFCDQATVSWLLLESTFMFNARSAPLLRRCRQIVTVGRMKWFEETAHSSTKDYCWFQFGRESDAQPVFVPRRT
jgi:hypothetical protein